MNLGTLFEPQVEPQGKVNLITPRPRIFFNETYLLASIILRHTLLSIPTTRTVQSRKQLVCVVGCI